MSWALALMPSGSSCSGAPGDRWQNASMLDCSWQHGHQQSSVKVRGDWALFQGPDGEQSIERKWHHWEKTTLVKQLCAHLSLAQTTH